MTVTRKQLQMSELLEVNDVTDPLTEMGPNENQKSGEPKRKGREMVPDHRSSHDQRERRWPREERACVAQPVGRKPLLLSGMGLQLPARCAIGIEFDGRRDARESHQSMLRRRTAVEVA